MKKFYTIMLAVLLSSIAAQAQEADYQPLVREGVRWVCMEEYPVVDYTDSSGISHNRILKRFYSLQFRGDTLIDGKVYKKLYREFIEGDSLTVFVPSENRYVYASSLVYSDTEPISYLREDNKRVYCKPVNSNHEDAIFIHTPDYVEFPHPYIETAEYIEYVYTEQIVIDGKPCRVYKDDNGAIFIEGIGFVSKSDGDFISCADVAMASNLYIYGNNIGLVHVEDLTGRIIYKGPLYEEPTTCMPLVREGVVWHWSWDEVDDQLDNDAYLYFNRRLYDFKIEFRGDTILCGIPYKKCYVYQTDTLNVFNQTPYCYAREDRGMVMFTPDENRGAHYQTGEYFDQTGEMIIYDFADFEGYITRMDSNAIVKSVDSVLVGNDLVPRYNVSMYNHDYYFVEGIGADSEYSRLFDPYPYSNMPTGNVSHWDGLIKLTDLDGNILYKGHNYDRFCYEQIGCQPLVREDRTWVNLYTYTDLENNKEIEFSYQLYFKGDTIIDGMTYKKCFRVAIDPEKASQCPAFFSDSEPIAAMREFDGQVYARYFKEEPDFDRTIFSEAHRLYDFYYYLYPNAWDSVEVDGQLCYVVQDKDFGTVISSIGVDNGMSGDLLYPQYSVLPGMQYDDIHFLYTLNGEGKIIYLSNYYEEYRASHQSDLNGDGVVDIADINILINVMLGYDVPVGHQGHDTIPAETAEKIMDMTGDGHVDITDINTLINKMLGK